VNKTVKSRIIVTATADVEMEMMSQPDGGTFIQAKLKQDDLMISVCAKFDDVELTQQVKDYLTYSAGHHLTEAVVVRMRKKLERGGEEQLPLFSNGGTVGDA
jgi:hypothetical protein